MKKIKTIKDVEVGLEKLLEQDRGLIEIAALAGPPPLRLQEPGFAGLARIVIAQLVSQASADAIYARFEQMVPKRSPEAFLDAGEETWIAIGMTRAKQQTLKLVAEALVAGNFDLEETGELPTEEATAQLMQFKGIGMWTAEVYLMFCAGHPDIFPAGDLALREAVRHGFKMDERPSIEETRAIAAKWTPLRGIAARLFWAYYKYTKNAAAK